MDDLWDQTRMLYFVDPVFAIAKHHGALKEQDVLYAEIHQKL